MFSSTNILDDSNQETEKNDIKWKNIFSSSLKKVLEQVHSDVTVSEDALLFIESYCLRLLKMLCTNPPPHNVTEIEERMKRMIPPTIDHYASKEGREVISKKKKTVLPVDRIHHLLQKEILQFKIDNSVSLYLVAVLEYVSADIFKLAGDYVRNIKTNQITKEDIEVVINADEELKNMFYQTDENSMIIPSPLPSEPPTYEEVVKNLINDEKHYLRDLHMILKVFREELLKIVKDPRDLEPIFSNITDIYDLTVSLLGSLEDVIEMSENEQSPPCVGTCFMDLAEGEEFNVYEKYANDVISSRMKDSLNEILSRPGANVLKSAGHGFPEAVKYYLPKLLLVPIWHANLYLDYIKYINTKELSPQPEDNEIFKQVESLLAPLHYKIDSIVATLPKQPQFKFESIINSLPKGVPTHSRVRRQLASTKIKDLQKLVEHLVDSNVLAQYCNEFIREDTLGKLGPGKRQTERKVYLFDGLMVLCKANRKPTVSATQGFDFKMKEKFFMKRADIIDRTDTDELKNAFEITHKGMNALSVILIAKNAQHKNEWIADLIMVNTKSMLERILDSILLDIEKKHPLRLPSPSIYRFAVPDSSENIILEEKEGTPGVPLIKGATLVKLIERLTYYLYPDPAFVRTFLITYRHFCTPRELMDLLIERFNIPHPSKVYIDTCSSDRELSSEFDKMQKNSQREDWKRYRKEYVQPVQFRVLNVLRHWVDNHFYDFEKDPAILDTLTEFLMHVQEKPMKKWVDSVNKIVQRKSEQEESYKHITFAFGNSPPAIENLNVPENVLNLLTLHPIELARQITLLQFEYYRNVKPSELVGSQWTKEDKQINSPNLLKLIKHTTNLTRWIEKQIIESENFEERVAMVSRALEVFMVMIELNNFNGGLAIAAAIQCTAVHRLKHTLSGISARHSKFLDELNMLFDSHLKKYQQMLKLINPPCVPFFGKYLTNIIHLEDGNPDFLPNTKLINFSKRRKIAEIIGEIQQYQNQPYCLTEDEKIRELLEGLSPFEGMDENEINDYTYNESLRIEPKHCKVPPKFPRKWPKIPLKSPGIKPKHKHMGNNNTLNHNNHHRGSICNKSMMDQSPPDGTNHLGVNDHSFVSFQHSSNFSMDTISLMSTTSTVTGSYDMNASLSHSPMSHLTSSTSDMMTTRADISPIYQHNSFSKFKSNKSIHHLEHSDSKSRSPVSPHKGTSFHFFPNSTHQACFNEIEPVPPSPHVNVPSTSAPLPPPIYPHHSQSEVRLPPPLPPRKNEAQRKQAPDAPLLPPRDEEANPPPLPPRAHHILPPPITSLEAKLLRDKPLPPISTSSSLLQPNTSTIMMRRNSALEKQRASQNSTDNDSAAPPSKCDSQNTLSTTTSATTTMLSATTANFQQCAIAVGVNSETYHQHHSEDNLLSISPAVSSSATSSPITPMTPMSPQVITSGVKMTCPDISSLLSCHGNRSSFVNNICSSSSGLPVLPPKPGSSGLYSDDKSTIFSYPSTNH